MAGSDTRAKTLNTSNFWHIVLPVLVLVILLFVLFVVYAMPDWALTCAPAMRGVQMLAKTPTTR
jgi:hypothetical protein